MRSDEIFQALWEVSSLIQRSLEGPEVLRTAAKGLNERGIRSAVVIFDHPGGGPLLLPASLAGDVAQGLQPLTSQGTAALRIPDPSSPSPPFSQPVLSPTPRAAFGSLFASPESGLPLRLAEALGPRPTIAVPLQFPTAAAGILFLTSEALQAAHLLGADLFGRHLSAALASAQAYAHLREEKDRLEELLSHSGLGLIVVDGRGMVVTWNEGAERIFGLPAAGAIGGDVRTLLAREPSEEEQAFVKRLVSTAVPTSVEVLCRRGNGQPVRVRLTAGVLQERTDAPPLYCGIAENLGEGGGAEGKPRSLEGQYRALMEGTSDLLCVLDRECKRVLCINRPFGEIPREDLLERGFSALWPLFELDSLEEFLAAFDRVVRTGERVPEVFATLRDPRTREVEHFVFALAPIGGLEGRVEAVQVLCRNITRVRHAERTLSALNDVAAAVQNRARARDVFHRLGETLKRHGIETTILLPDRSGRALRIEYASFDRAALRRAERVAGIRMADFRIPLSGTALVRDVVKRGRTRCLADCQPLVEELLPGNVRDQRARRVLDLLGITKVAMAPLSVGGKRVGALVLHSRDLSELDLPVLNTFALQISSLLTGRRMLQELRGVRGELEGHLDRERQEVVRLEQELRQALSHVEALREELIQSGGLSVAGRLAACVARELGNPLGIILGSLQFCLERMEVPGELREHLTVVERSARAACKSVRELLNIARPADILFAAVDLNEVVRSAAARLRTEAYLRSIEVRLSLDAALPPVWGDAALLEEVAMLLLLESLEGMACGGEAILTSCCERERRQVAVTLEGRVRGASPERVRTGLPGLEEREVEGEVRLPLGLCREILSLHRGTIAVEALPEGGMRVTVVLPALVEDAQAPAREEAPAGWRRGVQERVV